MAEDSTLISEFKAMQREYNRHCLRAKEAHMPLQMVVSRNRADSIKTEAADLIARAEKIESAKLRTHVISKATEIVDNIDAALASSI